MSSGNAKIGHPARNFKATDVMPDGQFKDISLSDYKGKYVVFFYPLDFTFSERGCFKEKEMRMEKSPLTTLTDKTLYKEFSPTTVEFIPAND
ncbi:hypothetical protein HPG69_005048 [Diceros bicornis minor]|uniref:Peroxiredoxin-1 n=1 Tax=Diceros bicornis minor TaxID=77932 RepID=A0A7J7EEL3_DICBM|nr:hypothetical protein HPG69_005048 [Diceros bicornis minor]